MFLLNLFKKYFLNFFTWWYLIKGLELVKDTVRFCMYVFVYLNVWPMLSHLFTPMFQDKSITGRIVAFPIRLSWGGCGLILVSLVVIASLIMIITYFALPVLPILELVLFLVN